MSHQSLSESFLDKIKTLNERVWEARAARPSVDAWLANFADDWDADPSEKVHALFLLSHFMYFGDAEIRVLLTSLFRDLYKYPIIEHLRETAGGALDARVLQGQFETELTRTRFLGIGNPAESGTHLLYYFRQENGISKDRFIHTHQIFDRRLDSADVRIADPNVKRYVLIDDFCGSGDQATEYSQKVIVAIRDAASRSSVEWKSATTYYSQRRTASQESVRTLISIELPQSTNSTPPTEHSTTTRDTFEHILRQ